MVLRHSLIAAASVVFLALAPPAGAMVLWDQSDFHDVEGSLNLSSNSCSQISGNTKVHNANDVTFSQPVHITNVRIYELQGNVETATQAYLWIAPKTGALPTASSADVNNAVNIVPIQITYETHGTVTRVVVSANNLNISLPAGDYWVSLTPRHSRGVFPYSVHLVTTSAVVGDRTASIDACTVNSNWLYILPTPYDYTIKIEGDFPVPALAKSWGRLKSIYR